MQLPDDRFGTNRAITARGAFSGDAAVWPGQRLQKRLRRLNCLKGRFGIGQAGSVMHYGLQASAILTDSTAEFPKTSHRLANDFSNTPSRPVPRA